MRNFSGIVRKRVGQFLEGKAFTYSGGYYKNEQPNGVRLMVAFDNGGRDSNKFNIMLLVNSVELDNDQGAHCVCYFTGGSLSAMPKNLPCQNMKALESGLERFMDKYDEIIDPYFSSFNNCSNIADVLSNQKGLEAYVGDLYFHCGKKRKARKAYKAWIECLPSMIALDKGTIEDEIHRTKAKIKKCGLFKRT